MGALAIAAAIAGIISAIKGIIDATATEQWESSVSGKLDLIIVQNASIIADLEQLPLEFAADLQNAFNTEAVIQGISLSHSFDQYMSGKHPDIAQIRSIRTPAENLANNITLRGPCVYQAANAMAALVIAIHKILHVDRLETQAFVNDVLSYMALCAGNTDGMFGKAITDTSTILQHATDVLANEPRGTVVVYSAQTSINESVGNRNITIHGTIQVLADISINDHELSFTVANARSTFFDIEHFDDGFVAGQANAWAGRIRNEINTIKQIQSRLLILQDHETAIQQITTSLRHWH